MQKRARQENERKMAKPLKARRHSIMCLKVICFKLFFNQLYDQTFIMITTDSGVQNTRCVKTKTSNPYRFMKRKKKKSKCTKTLCENNINFFQINMFCNFENKYDHLKLSLRKVK